MKSKICALLLLAGLAAPLLAEDPNDAGGTITTGGVSQLVLPAAGNSVSSPHRHYLIIQNISADWLAANLGAPAVLDSSTSFQLAPNKAGVLVFECGYIPDASVNIIGPNAGAKFVCKWK